MLTARGWRVVGWEKREGSVSMGGCERLRGAPSPPLRSYSRGTTPRFGIYAIPVSLPQRFASIESSILWLPAKLALAPCELRGRAGAGG